MPRVIDTSSCFSRSLLRGAPFFAGGCRLAANLHPRCSAWHTHRGCASAGQLLLPAWRNVSVGRRIPRSRRCRSSCALRLPAVREALHRHQYLLFPLYRRRRPVLSFYVRSRPWVACRSAEQRSLSPGVPACGRGRHRRHPTARCVHFALAPRHPLCVRRPLASSRSPTRWLAATASAACSPLGSLSRHTRPPARRSSARWVLPVSAELSCWRFHRPGAGTPSVGGGATPLFSRTERNGSSFAFRLQDATAIAPAPSRMGSSSPNLAV